VEARLAAMSTGRSVAPCAVPSQGRVRGPADELRIEARVDQDQIAAFGRRQPKTDEEIIALAQRLVNGRGGPVLLVTGDFSMQLRAEARGLTVVELSDGLRLPLGGDEEG
jgi:predicted ribonuclease YlaK